DSNAFRCFDDSNSATPRTSKTVADRRQRPITNVQVVGWRAITTGPVLTEFGLAVTIRTPVRSPPRPRRSGPGRRSFEHDEPTRLGPPGTVGGPGRGGGSTTLAAWTRLCLRRPVRGRRAGEDLQGRLAAAVAHAPGRHELQDQDRAGAGASR